MVSLAANSLALVSLDAIENPILEYLLSELENISQLI